MTARPAAEFDWRQFLTVGFHMALIILVALLARIGAGWLWVYAPFGMSVMVHDTAVALIKWTGVALAVVYGVARTR